MPMQESARVHPHLLTAARILAVTLGAYGLTALVTMALSLALAGLGMARVEAVTAATLASFAIFACLSMAAFHTCSVVRVWAIFIMAGAPLVLMIWLCGPK
ncbi:hypothetical protein [Novosphingobium sp. 9]|uniref:hypothetical protein n=1 Tax=Novosphingobium sp. 9 TaxID=2025349 RepID=UPI0021B5B6BA|nr:hypothetical protein [Novosphingobium sp. 9]